LPKQKSVRSIA